MENKKISIKTVDGFSISATHTIVRPFKEVVLWLHGITVNKDEYLGFFKDGADFMAKNGYDSLRIDFRGHGESSGKSSDFSIFGQMIDVEASINYLREYYKSSSIKIHLVGCSFGSPPSLFTFLLNKDIVQSVTLIAPVLSYRRTFLKPETAWAGDLFNFNTIKELYRTNKLYFNDDFAIGMGLFKEMQITYPENTFTSIDINVVVIHGNSDTMVPYQVSADIAQQYSNVTLVSMHEMDHGFNDINDEEGTSTKSQENKQYIFQTIKRNVVGEQ